MKEIWKDIKGYEGLYQVSNLGRVKRILFVNNVTKKSTNKILSNRLTSNGYVRVGLCSNGKVKDYKIHRLVANAFLPNPNNYPIINHKDGNKQNNNVTNLEWCTHSYNTKHALETGLINENKRRNASKNNIKIAQSYAKKHHLYSGENHHNAKLNEKDILEIKKIYQNKEMQIKQIALKYNVCTSTISRIVHNRSWTNI